MAWIELVSVLALVQYLTFGFLVAVAHKKFGVKVPAMSGNEVFERILRVQMNTLEQLMAFCPHCGWRRATGRLHGWLPLARTPEFDTKCCKCLI